MEEIKISDYKIRSVKEVSLIEIKVCTGAGTKENPARIVTEFWTKDGVFITRIDPHIMLD